MAKVRRKAMRRSHLKRYQSNNVYVSRGIDKEFMQELAYHDRTKSIGTEPAHKPIENETRADVRAMVDWMSERGVKLEHKVVLKRTRHEETSMYFGMKGSNCLIVQKLSAGVIRRSVLYDSRDKAITRYTNHDIIWVETHVIPSPATA